MTDSHAPRTALYPGSFDPVTLGHEDIARRTLKVADRVIVAVAHSSSQSREAAFPVEDRLDMLREVFADEPRITCVSFEGLLVDYARREGAAFVVRGLRAVSDFEYEFQMAQMNREMCPDMEFIFLMPDAHLSFLSASLVREVARLGGSVDPFVSPPVLRRLTARFGRGPAAGNTGAPAAGGTAGDTG
ncbi:MAG: pantetheine-phosphate adenylyltransferase [Gemmatimonadales bacterium]|nr:MAG: pantetheine-phosphate adenylyltransferase [Gemmatimonadales bacterium]